MRSPAKCNGIEEVFRYHTQGVAIINVIVFGANGLSGSQVVKETLARGHRVTAFVRRADGLVAQDRLTIMTGNPLDPLDVEQAVADHDVVVTCVGNMNFDDPTPVLTQFVTAALPSIGDRRFIVQHGSGMMLHDKLTLRRDLPDRPANLRYPREDHYDAYLKYALLDLDWLAVCPPWIVAGDGNGKYRSADLHFPKDAPSPAKVTAGNLGQFIANEVTNPAFSRTRVTVIDHA